MKTLNDYTHKEVYIKDIRLKRGKRGSKDDYFALTVAGIDGIIFVNYSIFNERIRSYFLGKSVDEVGRDLILNLKWNLVITNGFYLKIVNKDHFEKVEGSPGKPYISILEVSSPIGDFANNFAETVKIFEDKSYEQDYGVLKGHLSE